MDRTLGPIRRRQYGLPPPDFESADQTVAVDTELDVAHGLGKRPSLVQIVLKCTTAEIGFSIDDEVIVNLAQSTTADRSYTIFTDATNVSIVQGAGILLIGRSTLNTATLTPGSWRWVVRAWK